MANFSEQLADIQSSLKRIDIGGLQSRLDRAIALCHTALAANLPLLVCGNGGSAADAQHIAGELVGRFLRERRALNVRALVGDAAVLTAWANDYSYDTIFSRQVEAYGTAGGVLLGLSTSGNSNNVLLAAEAAKKIGMSVVVLTGEGGGKLAPWADVLLDVPSKHTPRIQEMHLMLYHYLCAELEARA